MHGYNLRLSFSCCLVVFALLIHSCEYNNFEEMNPVPVDSCSVPDTVSYSLHIAPLFNSSCGTADNNCHMDNNATGYGLGNYADVITTFDDEGLVNVIKRLNHDPSLDPAKWMPKDAPKLIQCEIDKIRRWIDQGRQDN
jgi:hypothetical protein